MSLRRQLIATLDKQSGRPTRAAWAEPLYRVEERMRDVQLRSHQVGDARLITRSIHERDVFASGHPWFFLASGNENADVLLRLGARPPLAAIVLPLVAMNDIESWRLSLGITDSTGQLLSVRQTYDETQKDIVWVRHESVIGWQSLPVHVVIPKHERPKKLLRHIVKLARFGIATLRMFEESHVSQAS